MQFKLSVQQVSLEMDQPIKDGPYLRPSELWHILSDLMRDDPEVDNFCAILCNTLTYTIKCQAWTLNSFEKVRNWTFPPTLKAPYFVHPSSSWAWKFSSFYFLVTRLRLVFPGLRIKPSRLTLASISSLWCISSSGWVLFDREKIARYIEKLLPYIL